MTTQLITDGLQAQKQLDSGEPWAVKVRNRPQPGRDFDYDVAIVGMGYVGLPTALAHHVSGAKVLGFDISGKRIGDIKAREVDLLPTDHQRLASALASDSWTLSQESTDLSRAAAVIVCVPTPVDGHHVPDLSILASASRMVVQQAVAGQLILMTSTTYAGCTREMIVEPLRKRSLVPGADISVAFSPERINPGVSDFSIEDVPRVVGGYTSRCREAAVKLLASYTGTVHRTSGMEVAEMTKLLENTFRAVNIAMANEFAQACQVLDLPVQEVIDSAATKPFGFMPFTPGPGVGGHCIPCDPHYLLWQLRAHNMSLPVIAAAMEGIEQRPAQTVARCAQVLSNTGKGLLGSRVLVVGLAYKPDVADLRESPALQIIDKLIAAGADVAFYDHHFPESVTVNGKQIIGCAKPAEFNADLVLLHTRHAAADLSWINKETTVLDATYRAEELTHRVLL
ncbi:UDP-glucose 6-dehydrogenase [Arthrobacter sp. MYb211]|uniref:nucleotide sugar dehydrogenase n=1 Tax=Micrococcaceae TaxID=1268 RepID=UPI000CFD1B3A|nr:MULTISPECIES: nucleotide sugar dehydrogenase [unclassified Arthrobacter]PQZ97007.1 UDP-glucose 6-dehydrogenase [Arthrobacter sp. MYb224]PQZ99193.1 UDP-glucose 6-dehydrogenase [Arthrobacter sp. MYb229]PRA10523.1 UDP-glucose 6-dehydrogenase [Arthrobacter sp. MYb221]PRB47578.1 UDP-glucose 6-dehydrogenase [Arthrobacter sp. MYb216]PRC06094.1 UDP-glucose 6-dehydrogenase [Arthrobacter sp. MYb211]